MINEIINLHGNVLFLNERNFYPATPLLTGNMSLPYLQALLFISFGTLCSLLLFYKLSAKFQYICIH